MGLDVTIVRFDGEPPGPVALAERTSAVAGLTVTVTASGDVTPDAYTLNPVDYPTYRLDVSRCVEGNGVHKGKPALMVQPHGETYPVLYAWVILAAQDLGGHAIVRPDDLVRFRAAASRMTSEELGRRLRMHRWKCRALAPVNVVVALPFVAAALVFALTLRVLGVILPNVERARPQSRLRRERPRE